MPEMREEGSRSEISPPGYVREGQNAHSCRVLCANFAPGLRQSGSPNLWGLFEAEAKAAACSWTSRLI